MFYGVIVCLSKLMRYVWFFFFQAEDGIRDLVRSRGLGDVYKRQVLAGPLRRCGPCCGAHALARQVLWSLDSALQLLHLSLIHI